MLKKTLLTLVLTMIFSTSYADSKKRLATIEEDNYATELYEFQKNNKLNDANSQYNLGFMYLNGFGVEEDSILAFKWYQLAASRGHSSAQFDLGWMYANGDGVPVNIVLSYVLYSLSAAQGKKIALENRDKLESSLTPAQHKEAQEIIKTWKIGTPFPTTTKTED